MAAAFADPQHDKDIEVKVQVVGDNVIVDLSLVVPATQQQVWAVLTDFDHMAGFISNLKESRVVSSLADTTKVFQRGTAKYGPISFPFESTREMQLTPFDKIRSHMISGNMRRMEGTTQLVDEGAQTRIIYHTDSIPGVWIPPIVGKVFIEHEIREQFQEMRNEIIRRKQMTSQGPQVTGMPVLVV
ncbi:MAG: SRPBCC family protein [Betaproteobacteria bacterium]|nr:SRPBCC family protein [Betaproteobacteria bacterium]MDE2310900.1 SRPBCC family protein [Betaproteobacteria bacterium]